MVMHMCIFILSATRIPPGWVSKHRVQISVKRYRYTVIVMVLLMMMMKVMMLKVMMVNDDDDRAKLKL